MIRVNQSSPWVSPECSISDPEPLDLGRRRRAVVLGDLQDGASTVELAHEHLTRRVYPLPRRATKTPEPATLLLGSAAEEAFGRGWKRSGDGAWWTAYLRTGWPCVAVLRAGGCWWTATAPTETSLWPNDAAEAACFDEEIGALRAALNCERYA